MGEAVVRVVADTGEFARDVESSMQPLEGAAGNVQSSFDSAGESMKNVGGTLSRTLTPAAAGAAVVLKKAGDDFNEGMRSLRTGTGATGEALDDLQKAARSVAGQTVQSFAEVGEAMARVSTRTGTTGDDLEGLTRQFLDLERLTGEAASSTIPAVTRVFGDWGIATDQQSASMDKLFQVSQATGPSVGRLSELVVKFGAPLRELGFGFEEAAAIMGKFEQEGVNTELVMGGLRQALGKMARAGEDPIETFKRVTDEIANAGSAAEANALSMELFGARAGVDMSRAIQEGRFELGDLIAELQDSEDTIVGVAAETATLGERLGMLRDRVMNTLGPFGEMGSVVAGAVAAIGPMMFGVGAMLPSLGKLTGVIGKMGGPTAALGGAVRGLGGAFRFLLGPVGIILTILGILFVTNEDFRNAVMDLVGTLMTALSPILTVVADLFGTLFEVISPILTLILDLVAGPLTLLIKAITPLIELFGALLAMALEPVAEILGFLIGLLEPVIGFLVDLLSPITGLSEGFSGLGGILETVTGIFERFGPIILAAVLPVVGIPLLIRDHWGTITEFFSRLWSRVREVFVAAVGRIRDAIVERFNNIVVFFAALPARILGALGNIGSLLLQAGKDLIAGFLKGITEMGKRIGDTILSPIKGAVGKVTGFLRGRSPSRLFADIGEDVIAGFVMGLEDEEQKLIRTLLGIAQRVGTVGADAFHIPAPSLGSAGTPAAAGVSPFGGVTQNITVNQVADDPVATARKVAFELGRGSVR